MRRILRLARTLAKKIMPFEFEITIPKTASRSIGIVVDYARKFTGGKSVRIDALPATFTVGAAELFEKSRTFHMLLSTAKNWKGFACCLDGSPVNKRDIESIWYIFSCAKRKETIPDQCLPDIDTGWGCRHLTSVTRRFPRECDRVFWNEPPHHAQFWFQHGSFNEDHSLWIIDKKEILAILLTSAHNSRVYLCNNFKQDVIEKNVEQLPDTIRVGDETTWEYVYKTGIVGDEVKDIPIGICPKIVMDRIREEKARYAWQQGPVNLQDDPALSEMRRNRFVPDVRFQDIGGIGDVVEKARTVIELPLKHPQIYEKIGFKPHKGILLFGPPGCGKTLVAKAIANEIEAHFIAIKGPEIKSKWHGESEHMLRRIFLEARENAPSIIFFDEIDAIAMSRNSDTSSRIGNSIVAQLLSVMDGIEEYPGVFVLASTNRPFDLDEAIMRPGRFDYKLEIKEPDEIGRLEIFQVCTRGKSLATDVNLEVLARHTDGLNGADIAFITREAGNNCIARCVSISELLQTSHEDVDLSQFSLTQGDFLLAVKKRSSMEIDRGWQDSQ